MAGAAGELVSTLTDLDRFYTALLGGELLPPGQLREMLNTRTAHGSYGMGLYPVKLPCGTTVWGTTAEYPAATCAAQPPSTVVTSSPSA